MKTGSTVIASMLLASQLVHASNSSPSLINIEKQDMAIITNNFSIIQVNQAISNAQVLSAVQVKEKLLAMNNAKLSTAAN